MKSYTGLRTQYGRNTLDTSSANLTQGDEWMNDELRHVLAARDWPFLHRARTLLTVASQQFYYLPYDMDQVESVNVVVGSQTRTPKMVHSREHWDKLNFTSFTSDYPEFCYVYAGQLGLWPKPASSSNTITLNGKIRMADLNTADDTSRTITTLANGSTALTVSGGLTAQHVGFWIRPTFSTTANTGDGNWYEIASVTNSTTAVLARAYGGASISAGTAACTIGQMSLLPEDFQDLPVLKSSETYWGLKGNDKKAALFGNKYKEVMAAMVDQYVSLVTDPVIDNGGEKEIINPNLTVQL